jgi:hypothetical protein
VSVTHKLQKLNEIRGVLKSLEWRNEPVSRQPLDGRPAFTQQRVFTPNEVESWVLSKLRLSATEKAALKNGFKSLWVEYELSDNKVFVWGKDVKALQRLLGNEFPKAGLER